MHDRPAAAPEAAPRPRRVIARQLAVGFALVSTVSLLMCALLLTLLGEVESLVTRMRDDEQAIRESLALATTVREQYIHQAHVLIERDRSHLMHYERHVDAVWRGVDALAHQVPPEQRGRLRRVASISAEADEVFRQRLLPEEGSEAERTRAHRDLVRLSGQASREADAVAAAVEARMVSAHVSAMGTTQTGIALGVLCVVAVVLLSFYFTWRLRRSVLVPLGSLVVAARRIGAGRFDTAVGPVGEGELRAVAEAFDRMAAELRERERKIVAAERMAVVGQLAAGVAHEINNPIGVIRGYLRTMSPDTDPGTLAEELQILDEEAAACQRIAEDLLAYSKVPELAVSSFRIDALLEETAKRFAESQEHLQREVRVNAEEATIDGDSGRLRQVILNLLRNAHQVAPPGSPIEVRGEGCDGGYEIRVIDAGPGIPEEDLGRIFEPFFSRKRGGSGLGLAVCHGIVSAHGGSIEARPRDGEGTELVVRMPAGPVAPGLQ